MRIAHSITAWGLLPAPHPTPAGLGLVGGAIASLDVLVGEDSDGGGRFVSLSAVVHQEGLASSRPYWLLRGWEPVSSSMLLLAYNVRAGLPDGAWSMDTLAAHQVLQAHIDHIRDNPARLTIIDPAARRPRPRRRHPRIEAMERRLAGGASPTFLIIDDRDLSPAPRSETIRADLVRVGRRLYGVPALPSLKRSIVIDGRLARDRIAFERAIEIELDAAARFGRSPAHDRAPRPAGALLTLGDGFLDEWG